MHDVALTTLYYLIYPSPKNIIIHITTIIVIIIPIISIVFLIFIFYSTVTDLARFLGLSTTSPFATLT